MGVIVIDEKSMMGQHRYAKDYHLIIVRQPPSHASFPPSSSRLVMIDQRLKEIKPHKEDQPFAGVSIIILGDW